MNTSASGFRVNARAALIATVLACAFAVPTPVAASIPEGGGTCVFGAASTATPALTATMTATLLTLSGRGSCTSSFGRNAIDFAIDTPGSYACGFGVGGGTGTISFSPTPPNPQAATQSRIVTVGPEITVVLNTNDDSFIAAGTLSWTPAVAQACLATGTMSGAVSGELTFLS